MTVSRLLDQVFATGVGYLLIEEEEDAVSKQTDLRLAPSVCLVLPKDTFLSLRIIERLCPLTILRFLIFLTSPFPPSLFAPFFFAAETKFNGDNKPHQVNI